MKVLNVSVWRIISLLFLVAIVEQFATDCYLPSFPAIARAFEVNSSAVQLSLTIFIAGEALSQIIFGALSDLYGRRRILIIGLITFAFSSLFCTVATHISEFLLGRL